jgi:hypothetical protein
MKHGPRLSLLVRFKPITIVSSVGLSTVGLSTIGLSTVGLTGHAIFKEFKITLLFFPAILFSQNCFQLKKLVYVYLVRYAEEQQDLALLSISTFQRGLKDPNQLIRV